MSFQGDCFTKNNRSASDATGRTEQGLFRMKRSLVVTGLSVTIFCFFLFSGLSAAREMNVLETSEVTVLFDDRLESAARQTAALYPELVDELEESIGWRLQEPCTVALINDRTAFRSMAGMDYVAAVAVPSRRLVVVDYTRAAVRPFSFRTILKHELCHLLLHGHIDSERLPRWLDEGIAQWTSDGMAEIAMKRDRFLVPRAAVTGNIIPLRRLDRGFPRTEKGALLAYEMSKNIIDYIIREYGPETPAEILENLRRGNDIDEALQTVILVPLDELERRWHADLRGGGSWISFWAYHLYEILFVAAALLSAAAFLRYLKRRRDYSRFDDGDDGTDY